MKAVTFDRPFRRLASIIVAAGIAATIIPWPGQVAQAANAIETVATSYVPTVSESIDASGFKHPGLGYTKEMLDNVQAQVRAQKEPWNAYFNGIAGLGSSSRTPTVQNTGNGTSPRFYGLASQAMNDTFIADGMTAYGQAFMYLITGDDVYRANGMRIIRIYEQMDPTKYAYFTDSHIHTGIPLQRMLAAAEILRATSTQTPALEWTDDDTAKLTANLIIPVMDTFNFSNGRFMNQHLYTTIANMAGSIFIGDRARYDRSVEWFTVNKGALDQGQNGSIKQLFRLVTRNDSTGEPVTPVVQHVEMGRDQAHGGGDITNAEILARMMLAQGTKVDPVEGTPSTAANAVGPYEFLDDRILTAAESYATYMVGYNIPWVPTASHTDADGNPTVVYIGVSNGVRGRTTMALWDLFYYYQYVRGVDMTQRAPNFTRFFHTRGYDNWSGHDGGGDYWIGIPKEAEAEGSKYGIIPTVGSVREVEDRYTALDGNTVLMKDGTQSYLRVTATPEGSALAVYGYSGGASSYGIRIRTNGIATGTVRGISFVVPDTQGQWRYVILPIAADEFQRYIFTGAGTTVDFDHLELGVSASLSPPAFTAGAADVTLYSYAGTTLASTFDFSATDAGAGDVVTYQGGNLPAGASIDPATGAFSWIPTQAGTYSFFVSASDGTTTVTKNVTVIVDADRQGAVNRATAPYNPNTVYVVSSVPQYNSAYADMMSVIGSGSDEVFVQKLTALRAAAAALVELTPLVPSDGSFDYTKSLYASDMGPTVTNWIDGGWAFVDYKMAKDNYTTLTMDFGPYFKVSANRFDLQAVGGFPERGEAIAIFASNDNETWTRLTPGESIFLDAMQTLPMTDEALKTTRFRWFRIQMMRATGGPLQLTEFRIFGQRYETVHKISTVSIAAPNAFKGRVVEGDAIQVSFVADEPINEVTATIQGIPATVTTTDNVHWTASAVVNATMAGGAAKFLIKYKTQEGVDAEPVFLTTDKTSVIIQETPKYLGNLPAIATLSDSSNDSQSTLLSMWNTLSDRNMYSQTQFRVGSSGNGAWLEFDFGGGGTVKLSRVEVLAIQNDYYARINGTVVQGSNDNTTWTTISNSAGSTKEWQNLTVGNQTPYRYIRMYNPNAWFGNMSELRLYGVATSTNKIAFASIGSAQSLAGRVQAGDTVTLNFTAKEAISSVTATIAGMPATLATTDNVNYTATATLPQNVPFGPVTFAIDYLTLAGTPGYAVSETTDGTALSVTDNTGYIANLLSIASVTDSGNQSQSALLADVNKLFDSNLTTINDFRTPTGSGAGSWVAFDFRGGGTVALSRVDVIGSTHFAGTVVQGSNDYANWTTISNAGVNSTAWQTLTVSDTTPYRYVRMYNPNTWYGNMGELRLYGTTASSNKMATASISSAQALRTRIVPGNAVKLSFTAKEAISNVSATIQGVAATVATTDNINFTATATLPQGVAAGAVTFAVNYTDQSGQSGYPLSSTTDNTALNLVDEADVIKNFSALATLIDSTSGRSASSTLSMVNALGDSSLSTGSDFRNGSSSGSGAYIEFDFKAGNQVNLSNVELIGSQDSYSSRVAGVVIQGSNDGTSWTALTAGAVNTQEWQNLKVASLVPYRYIRIYNAAAWYGTMREVRFHGSLHAADVAAPVTSDNAPTAWVNTDTAVTLTAADPSGVAATYYTVDGGAQQTGKSLALTTEGNHALAYWSVDWAGNVEQKHTVSVKIDKTAPVTTATPDSAAPNGWYHNNVVLTLSVLDTGAGAAASYFTVDGGAQQTGNTVALSNGIHSVTYWSVDQAGNVEQPRALAVNVGPIDVSAIVKLVQQSAILNRTTGKFTGSVSVTNTGGAALSGPLQLKLNSLATGVTLDNASGSDGGAFYVTLPGPLNAGATISVPLTFTNPNRVAVTYTPAMTQGNF